jgi:hypothetical protein
MKLEAWMWSMGCSDVERLGGSGMWLCRVMVLLGCCGRASIDVCAEGVRR